MPLARRIDRLEAALHERLRLGQTKVEGDARSQAVVTRILAHPEGPALLAEWGQMRAETQQEHGGALSDPPVHRRLFEHPTSSARYCQMGLRLTEIAAG
jgi:hypothetical protein